MAESLIANAPQIIHILTVMENQNDELVGQGMMKKTVGILLLILFLILIFLPWLKSLFRVNYHYVEFESVEIFHDYLSYRPGQPPLVSAHRGGPMPGFPENAIETFQNSLRFAPCLIEFDVRMTRDHHLVLMHDADVDRTTNGQGRVSDFTVEQIKTLRLQDAKGQLTEFRIPTLSEVLEWGKGKAILEIDLKEDIPPGEILSVITEKNALSHTLLITYNMDQLIKYAELNENLLISASAHTVEGVLRILESGIDPSRLVVFVGVTEPQPEVYELLHSYGILAVLGTIHNIDNAARRRGLSVYEKVLRNGADILATDNVPLAAQAIKIFLAEEKYKND